MIATQRPASETSSDADSPAAAPADAAGDDLAARIARGLKLDRDSVSRVLELLDEGATLPYLARYRRDDIGGLDERTLQAIRASAREARELADRKRSILRSLEGQAKLTDALRESIEKARSLPRLDDLYLPHKPAKPTAPGVAEAIEQGLQPLANEIASGDPAVANLDQRLADFVSEDKKVPDAATALAGAGQILAQRFSEQADIRKIVRNALRKTGRLVCKRNEAGDKKPSDKKAEPYKGYFEYREPLGSVPPHRVMAINRGERAGVLAVSVEMDIEVALSQATDLVIEPTHQHADFRKGCVLDAIQRLVVPSLAEEARRQLNDKAEAHSLEVFARNLRNLLMQPPLPGQRVLGIDPGYKKGCHYAALDEAGAVLATGESAVLGTEEELAASRKQLAEVISEHRIDLIALGNGKACRQTEEFIATMLAEHLPESETRYTVVGEAGASVYAGSTIGREELAELGIPARCAVSIGRRLQDPLAELVKIDPASVGVGLYQHDMKAAPMRAALEEAVASCVSHVGVDVNKASAAVLRYVAGLNPLSARRLCEYRQEHGPFTSRQQIQEAGKLSDAAYRQAAGFIKVTGGDPPDASGVLDATWVHPESYEVAERLLTKLEIDPAAILTEEGVAKFREAAATLDLGALAEELSTGPLALKQIVEALRRPGSDPRTQLPPPVFRRGVVKFEDLEPGMELRGKVLNVVDFGAFVDVGLSDSGLVHISRMSNGYVGSPHEIVAVGNAVQVWVASVDAERKRVSLTMVEPGAEKPKPSRGPRRRRGGGKPTGNQAKQSDGAATDQGAESSKRSGGGRPSGGRRDRNRRDKSRPGGRGQSRDNSRGGRSKTYESRSKAPPKPITREMEEGTEAMRTFGDLLQFHQKKSQGEEKPSDEGEAPKA